MRYNIRSDVYLIHASWQRDKKPRDDKSSGGILIECNTILCLKSRDSKAQIDVGGVFKRHESRTGPGTLRTSSLFLYEAEIIDLINGLMAHIPNSCFLCTVLIV